MHTLSKLARLRAMPLHEVAYRLRERLRVESERLGVLASSPAAQWSRAWDYGAPDEARESFLDYLRTGPGRRFYFPSDGAVRRLIRETIRERFPHWIDRAVREAEALCDHRVELLGFGPVSLGKDIDWHRDPISGVQWPVRYWHDYNLVKETAGDPKVVCELGRHQHLPRLAKAYYLTGDERFAQETIAQIESWIEQNPPGVGIHWNSSLEIGIRVVSWLWALFFLLPSECLDEPSARRVGRALFAQLDHVDRYPSVYSSPNTHLIGEATALFCAALLFPEFRQAERWLRRGAGFLLRELDQQVSSGGAHLELSTYYHCYALDFYLQAGILALRNRLLVPLWTRHRILRMIEFLSDLTRIDGSIPRLGDDDGGRALALVRSDYASFQDALCAGAILYRRPELKFIAGEFAEETFWLLGAASAEDYRAMPIEPPQRTTVCRPGPGLVIQRSESGHGGAHVVFDCGGLGMGTGGHSHADALSVCLSIGGQDVLIDPGTGVYNGAPLWRGYFRSTPAHNTISVDAIDQCVQGGTFGWNTRLRTRLLHQIVLPDTEFFEAEHDGYARLTAGVFHRRGLLRVRPDRWFVIDEVHGAGTHSADLWWHFAPHLSPTLRHRPHPECLVATSPHGLLLAVCSNTDANAAIIGGATNPVCGWASRRYGERRPAHALCVTQVGPLPLRSITTLAVTHGEDAPLVRQPATNCSGAVGCQVRHRSARETIIATDAAAKVAVDALSFAGRICWLETHDGELTRLLAIGARSLAWDGEYVVDQPEPLPYLSISFTGGEPEVLPVRIRSQINVRNLRHCTIRPE